MRLTNSIRHAIIDEAISKFDASEENQKFKEDCRNFAEKAIVEFFGGEEKRKKTLAAIKRAEKALSDIDSGISQVLTQRSQIVKIYSEQRWQCVEVKLSKQTVTPRYIHIISENFPVEMIKEFSALEKRCVEIEKKRTLLRQSSRELLKSVTTVKRLRDAWPEVDELLPKDLNQVATPNLPAVQVKSLNEMLGLPTEKKAA